MGQFTNVLLAIDRVQTVSHRAVDYRPGGLNQDYWPNCPTPVNQNVYSKYIVIFTRCTTMNQYDILMTAVADVSKGQTDMS